MWAFFVGIAIGLFYLGIKKALLAAKDTNGSKRKKEVVNTEKAIQSPTAQEDSDTRSICAEVNENIEMYTKMKDETGATNYYTPTQHFYVRINNYESDANKRKEVSYALPVNRQRINLSTIDKVKSKFIAIDCETTGLNPKDNRIVEISAVKFVNCDVVDQYSSLVKSDIPIPDTVSKINHITNKMLEYAPTESEVMARLFDFFGDAVTGKTIICAHNASFDMRFLTDAFKRCGIDASFNYLDTLKEARHWETGLSSYKQVSLAEFYGIDSPINHRAENDAKVCGNILIKLIEKASADLQSAVLSEDEKAICERVKKILRDANKDDLNNLRYIKNKTGTIQITYIYTFVKFKCSKRLKYIIVSKEVAKQLKIETFPCSKNEGSVNVRMPIESPEQIDILSDYISKSFDEAKSSFDYLMKTDKNSALDSLTLQQTF